VSLKTAQFGHIADKHLPQRLPILFAGGKAMRLQLSKDPRDTASDDSSRRAGRTHRAAGSMSFSSGQGEFE